ncbi:MAG: homoserine dehydrogenase [Micrococcales bacterium 73-13]|nr:MAG: homoserine dehydrogenase [Micrococcales bacterium 73-13]
MMDYRNLRIAILGGGNVGANVADLLIAHRGELEARVGAGLEVVGVAVRDLAAPRTPAIPAELLTTDAASLVTAADIVVELIGGIEPARTLVLSALRSGADVITANKALLATHGDELFQEAAQVGAQLHYEAAVAAAIPIIRPLRESLAGDRVRRILGIVNGSTNFILDKMDAEGWSTEEAMRVARELGYLEADPTLDVEGYDAAQKAAILASLAFHTRVPLESVHREGITGITGEVVAAAKAAGYVVKLLAIAERVGEGDLEGVVARVHPALVPRDHPLAAVHGGNNAVFVEAEFAGPLMFYGAGAGGVQTASAVLGDIVSAARRHLAGGPGVAESTSATIPILPFEAVETRYQIALEVADVPGVLAQVAGVIAGHGVSIERALQSASGGADPDPTATLVIVTHRAREAALAATVAALAGSPAVRRVASVIRVEGL